MDEIEQFFRAVEGGDVEAVRVLVAAHPDLARARDDRGATGLHHAAFLRHGAIAQLLCDSGADVNARDTEHGATPAGWAIHSLRERGGLLAVEIDDALFAIQRRDATWATRLIARHPALQTAADALGKPLAAHARECGDTAIADLFTPRSR